MAAAIDTEIDATCARRELVDSSRHDLFAGSRLAEQEHGGGLPGDGRYDFAKMRRIAGDDGDDGRGKHS